MPSARVIIRGFDLNWRFAVNGIQKASRSVGVGAVLGGSESRVMASLAFGGERKCTASPIRRRIPTGKWECTGSTAGTLMSKGSRSTNPSLEESMQKRKLLSALVVSSIGVIPVAASAAAIIVTEAPPEPRYEVAPAHRHGYVWAPGYWDHRHGHYVWVEGHW